MAQDKKYWVGLEELHETEEFLKASQNEFMEDVQSVDEFLEETDLESTSTNRRDFLKFLGFSVTAATIAACETPVIHSIPYVNKPEHITAGVPTYYASTFYDGFDYASIVVKTREGRPIFLKGNHKHGINQGAVTARVNSSVLSLYDGSRLKNPRQQGQDTTWENIDASIKDELRKIADSGKTITLLTGTIISPSTQEVIEQFKSNFGQDVVRVVVYDPISRYGIRKGNELSFGRSFIPDYDFSKVRTLVSVDADFMDNWLLHNQYVPQFAKTRNPNNDWMSKHYHIESRLSLSGSNADVRIPIKPSQEAAVVSAIFKIINDSAGDQFPTVNSSTDGLPMGIIEEAAKELMANRGRSLFICGSNDPYVQVLANAINKSLGNYGSVISTDTEIFINQGNDKEVKQLVADMNAGRIGALLIHGDINPSYSLPNAEEFNNGLNNVELTVSFSKWADETASRCKYICPDHHYLESWNDFYPKTGHYSLAQPTITQLYNTRQFQDSLLTWSGNSTGYHDFIKSVWRKYSAAAGDASLLFDDFWYNALRNGSVSIKIGASQNNFDFDRSALQDIESKIPVAQTTSDGDFEVVLHTNVGIGNGSHATNPWLQELPDPISKITWDNYIAMNPADAEERGMKLHIGEQLPASLAEITINGKSLVLPVVAQPGQKRGTVSIALGYGRGAGEEEIGRAAYRTKQYGGYELDEENKKVPIGKNLYPFVDDSTDYFSYKLTGAKIENTKKLYAMASTQTHHTIMDRHSVVRETTYKTFKSSPKEAYNPPHVIPMHEKGIAKIKDVDDITLWESHPPVKGVGHRWGMSIDLTTCIGCSACVTACHSENNVPVVGKDEIRRARDMHWLRIDRYYSSAMSLEKGADEGKGVIATYREMEVPEYENPTTIFMPMMCQHCNNAPCETVCPVVATTHSDEGLNQMTYNRCIGTRYCANNCPYKVRRFNWFNYKAYDKFAAVNPAQDVTARMVLNPDVTVRSRGVMEKCSMCVQRIQMGKLDAKMKGEPVHDGAILTACAEACPTNAISFGDLNDSDSKVAADQAEDRSYYALEEIGIRPNVGYKMKIRNI